MKTLLAALLSVAVLSGCSYKEFEDWMRKGARERATEEIRKDWEKIEDMNRRVKEAERKASQQAYEDFEAWQRESNESLRKAMLELDPHYYVYEDIMETLQSDFRSVNRTIRVPPEIKHAKTHGNANDSVIIYIDFPWSFDHSDIQGYLNVYMGQLQRKMPDQVPDTRTWTMGGRWAGDNRLVATSVAVISPR